MNIKLKMGDGSLAGDAGFGDLTRQIEADMRAEIARLILDENPVDMADRSRMVRQGARAAVRNFTRNRR